MNPERLQIALIRAGEDDPTTYPTGTESIHFHLTNHSLQPEVTRYSTLPFNRVVENDGSLRKLPSEITKLQSLVRNTVEGLIVNKPDLIGISAFLGSEKAVRLTLELLEERQPGFLDKTYIGGGNARHLKSWLPQRFKSTVLIEGDGVIAMNSILDQMKEREEVNKLQIPNAVFINENGELIETQKIPITKTDPRTAGYGLPEMLNYPRKPERKPQVFIFGDSYGCYGVCTFCQLLDHGLPKTEHQLFSLLTDEMIQEFSMHREKGWEGVIAFASDNFFPGKKTDNIARAQELLIFLETLNERGVNPRLSLETRTNDILSIPDEVWTALKERGLEYVLTSPETFVQGGEVNQRIRCKKGGSVAKDIIAVRKLQTIFGDQKALIGHIFVDQLMKPYAWREELVQNLLMFKQLRLYRTRWYPLSQLRVTRGTKYHKMVEEADLVSPEDDGVSLFVSTDFIHPTVKAYVDICEASLERQSFSKKPGDELSPYTDLLLRMFEMENRTVQMVETLLDELTQAEVDYLIEVLRVFPENIKNISSSDELVSCAINFYDLRHSILQKYFSIIINSEDLSSEFKTLYILAIKSLEDRRKAIRDFIINYR